MEGSFFLPQGRPSRTPDLNCSECGASFRPRRVMDGVEELCDTCYEARFTPHPTPQNEQAPGRSARRLAAD